MARGTEFDVGWSGSSYSFVPEEIYPFVSLVGAMLRSERSVCFWSEIRMDQDPTRSRNLVHLDSPLCHSLLGDHQAIVTTSHESCYVVKVMHMHCTSYRDSSVSGCWIRVGGHTRGSSALV